MLEKTGSSFSAWKISTGTTISGVDMLLSPLAYKALMNIEEIDPRVIITSFNVNPITTNTSCYLPTNSSDEVNVIYFYQWLLPD